MRLRTVAVVIGVNQVPGQARLRNAENDAREIAQFLAGPGGPIAADDVVLLLGSAATSATVEETFDKVAERNPDVMLVFFAGHGRPTEFCLADRDCRHATFAGWVRRAGAGRGAVVVDACHAGAVATGFGIDEISGPPDEDWRAAFARSLPGMRFLLSSRPHESSSDGPGRHGSFTEGLLTAFRRLPGKRFADGRRYLSAESVFLFAREWVRRATDGAQTPMAFGPIADFPIARPTSRAAGGATVQTRTPAPRAAGTEIGSTLVAGLLAGLAVYAIASVPTWDRNVERYRRRDGRFW